MCFVFILEQTANFATYIMNLLVFITEVKSVYSAVRTGSLNKAVCASSLRFNFQASHYAFRQNTASELQTFTGLIFQLSSEDVILVYLYSDRIPFTTSRGQGTFDLCWTVHHCDNRRIKTN